MATIIIATLLLALCSNFSFGQQIAGNLSRFPASFQFGSATSAYQIEGAWDADGKGETIWDRFTHRWADRIFKRQTADVSADSYHKYKEDVQLLKAAGMNFYRFSISWSRILPRGDASEINSAGLQYYSNLIDELLANGIEPMITIYHFDLPQPLQEIGGLTNPAIVDYFVEYARVLFTAYGARVRTWITMNEPWVQCIAGYSDNLFAPGVYAPGVGNYLCSHHMMLAHGRIYELYHKTPAFRRSDGRIGMSVVCEGMFPRDPQNATHVAAAERAMQFVCGMYSQPIFGKDGGYPAIVVDTIERRSRAEGRAWSRLPRLSDADRELLRGSADFLGVNYYTSFLVEPAFDGSPGAFTDPEVLMTQDLSLPQARTERIRSMPQGLRRVLNWIREAYNNPAVIITENGWSDDGELEDTGRLAYLRGHLQAVLDALNDGCRVLGHATWSLLDNFEFVYGYSQHFGLYQVDFESPERTRTPKASVAWLRSVIETRVVPPEN